MERSQSESTDTSKSKSTGSISRRRNRKRSASMEAGNTAAATTTATANGTAAAAANAAAYANGADTGSEGMSYEVLDFQPASYLIPPLEKAGSYTSGDSNTTLNSNSNTTLNSNSNSNPAGHGAAPSCLYGIKIPPLPPQNCCAACHGTRNEELREDTVLLCDGSDCGLEFHLQCCVPIVSEIPAGAWYCFDCSSTGSTGVLQQYLEQNDERKADFETWEQYRESLWEIDFQEDGAASPPIPASATAPTTATAPRRPKSELDRAFQSHELALLPERKSPNRKGPSKKARARISTNMMVHPQVVSVPDCMAHADLISQMDTGGEQHRHPQHFLGRPVRLYNPAGNTYHTGRIVDWRETSSWPSDMSSASLHIQQHFHSTMKEYLVRFTAGMDDRKTPYQHWIVLEEHGTLRR
jgi:hypothetical protein